MAHRSTNQTKPNRNGNTDTTRKCCLCNQVKPLSDFPDDKCQKYGKSYKCRSCELVNSAERVKRYRFKNPDKHKARLYISKSRQRELRDNEPCLFCGTTAKIEHHHPDYRFKNLVVCLCETCHSKLHRILRAGNTPSL